jgi:hypothetical protein
VNLVKGRKKFRITHIDGEWHLFEPGFLHVSCLRRSTFGEMIEDFRHILKAEQVKRGKK